jgi:hypothetical protein
MPYKIAALGYYNYVYTPTVAVETYETLIAGHTYTWSLSWLKWRQDNHGTIYCVSKNRSLIIQEYKR